MNHETTSGSGGPLESCIPMDGLAAAGATAAPVRSCRLAGCSFASSWVSGAKTAFPGILAACDQVCSWVEEAGATRVRPPHEIWQVPPRADEPAELTVAWPCA